MNFKFNNQYGANPFGGMPIVTKNIIIVNVLMFLLKVIFEANHVDLDYYFGLHHHLAPAFKPHQFFTYIFMHADLRHLLFNMFGVYMFGSILEGTWGQKRFLIYYVLTGFAAAFTEYAIMNHQITTALAGINDYIDTITDTETKAALINQKYDFIDNLNHRTIVGASGSLYGILGAVGFLFPNLTLQMVFFPIKAMWLVILYGGAETFLGMRNNPNDHVAHFAHLGGLLVGIIILLIWRTGRQNFY